MATTTEKISLVIVITLAICVVILAGAFGIKWAFGTTTEQYINAPTNYGTVTPVSTPVSVLPQVLQMTVAQVTYVNGHFEVDGTDGTVAYFPDLTTCKTIVPGATYLFTPYGMSGTAYLISNTITPLSPAPYQSSYSRWNYNSNPDTWQKGHIYVSNGYRWHYFNGGWTIINPSDIPRGTPIYQDDGSQVSIE